MVQVEAVLTRLASIVGGGSSIVRVNIRNFLYLGQRYFAETLVIDYCES